MRIAYLDCFSGISGDMLLGALVDAGADREALETALKGLGLKGWRLTSRRVWRAGLSALKVDVVIDETAEKPRKWPDMKAIIEASSLSEPIKSRGLAIFKGLFAAEASVHDKPLEEVHLHELAGTDCMVDIMGGLIGLDLLGIQEVLVSPVNLGSGFVKTSHGKLPVPAPATAELLRGFPVYSSDPPFELTTPTGAALLKGVARPSAMPLMTLDRTGCGAGGREIPGRPNLLRLFLGEWQEAPQGDRVGMIETNIDDMSPQIYEDVMEKLFTAGALDVWLEQIIMKKGRPAVKLTALCPEEKGPLIREIIFRETTTIGLRYTAVCRQTLERETGRIGTRFGEVGVKKARLHGQVINIRAEYDDLKEISHKTGIPIKVLATELEGQALLSEDMPLREEKRPPSDDPEAPQTERAC